MFEIDNISAFDNMLSFDIRLLSLSIFIILLFLTVWLIEYKKTGWKIDFWHCFVGVKIIFPAILMYPFSQSIYNFDTIDEFLPDLTLFMPVAFIVSLVGCAGIYVGRFIFDRFGNNNKELKLNFIENAILSNSKDKRILNIFFTIYAILFLIVFCLLFLNNALFAGRDFFQSNDSIRPIFNLTLSVIPHLVMFAWLHYDNSKKPIYLYACLTVLMSTIFYGTRSVLVEPIFFVVILYAVRKNIHFKLRYVVLAAVSIFFLIFLILFLREGRLDSMSQSVIYSDILYGSTFSDLRDFAWFLSSWDFNFLYGKSYLAGIISFVPRFISEFRQEWSLGVITTRFIGFDIEDHPGLRIGPFGELFINFGYWGVTVISILLGYFLRRIDYLLKKIMVSEQPEINKAYVLITHTYLLLCLTNSIGFMLYYSFLFLILAFSVSGIVLKKLDPYLKKR